MDPDIVIGIESKLGPEVLDADFFPEAYTTYRKERKLWRRSICVCKILFSIIKIGH